MRAILRPHIGVLSPQQALQPQISTFAMLKALIFDFDGLILDTETPDVDVWKAMYAEHGYDYPVENWSRTVGGWGSTRFDPALTLHELAGNTLDAAALRADHRRRSDALILGSPILAGVQDYLNAAQRLGLR